MKIKYLFWGGAALPLLLQLACNSCMLNNPGANRVDMDIVWTVPVSPEGQISMAFDGDIAYRAEAAGGGFVAINLDSGAISVRVTNTLYHAANPILIANSIYLYDADNPIIWEFTKQGNLVRKIWVTSGSGKPVIPQGYVDPYRPRMCSWSNNGTRLFWGARWSYKDTNYGVETFDVLIDPQPTGDPNEYWVKPTTIYSDLGFNFSCEYLFDLGIMYIAAWRQEWYHSGTYNGYAAAINLTDYSLKWRTTFNDGQLGRKTLYMLNNRLYVANIGLHCLDPTNGNILFENLLCGFGDPGATVINDKIYTTNESGGSNLTQDNVQCLETASGNLFWSYKVSQQTIGQNPIVFQGICYVPTQIDVKLFNAETGAYLGYATNITGDGNFSNSNYLWVYNGDTWMIINGTSFVAAVRLNFRIDGAGKLYKVN
jgi:hypothetical protein